MSDNEAFLSALKIRIIIRTWQSFKLFLLPDFLAFSVLPCESYLLKTLYMIIFGIFLILATCSYDWPNLINSTISLAY
jgi:hypothetical protein